MNFPVIFPIFVAHKLLDAAVTGFDIKQHTTDIISNSWYFMPTITFTHNSKTKTSINSYHKQISV